MEILGVGLPELVLILVVILVIFGPDRLPEIAKKLGETTRDLRRSWNDINSEVNENLKPLQEIKEITSFASADTSKNSNLIVAEDPAPKQPSASKETSLPAAPPAQQGASEASASPADPDLTSDDPSI